MLRLVAESLVCVVLSSVVLADGGQVESAIVVTEGAEPVSLAYGDHTSGARIDSGVDLDTYSFTAAAGDEILIIVDGIDVCVDPGLDLFGPSGFHETSGCGVNCFASCSFEHRTVLPSAGQYTIVMSDLGSEESGAYVLQLERIVPAPVAAVLAHGFAYTTRIDPGTDVDYVQFHGLADELVRIVLNGLDVCVDPYFELLDPSGSSIDIQFCGTNCFAPCSFTREIVLPSSGLYTLLLRDAGAEEVGNVRVSVNCLTGCPPTTQVVTRNGSGSNLPCYTNAFTPTLGGRWCGRVDTSSNPGAFLTLVHMYSAPRLTPLSSPWGEILIDRTSALIFKCQRFVPAGETSSLHEADVPSDPGLIGFQFFTQAGSFAPGSLRLCNAIDYTLGF